MKNTFKYYYGSQADQFSFIRIPKILLTERIFESLSLNAKVLYGILLDRMSLSRKNGWLDGEKRVFIIYQIGEIQEDLRISRKKAIDLLAELEKFGLVEKKRRGHGLPNILYVKNFMPDSGGGMEAGTAAEEVAEAPVSESRVLSRSPVFRTSWPEEPAPVAALSGKVIVPGKKAFNASSSGSGTSGYSSPKSVEVACTDGRCFEGGQNGKNSEKGGNQGQNRNIGMASWTKSSGQSGTITGHSSLYGSIAGQSDTGKGRLGASCTGLSGAKNTEISPADMQETDSRSSRTSTSGMLAIDPEVPKPAFPEVPKPELQEVPDSAFQEVPKSELLKSKTEENNTELNQIESNHIKSSRPLSPAGQGRQDDEIGFDRIRSDGIRCDREPSITEEYRDLICENISYDELLAENPYDRELVGGILDLILETVLCESKSILIASSPYPSELVKSKFLKLDYWHIQYVIRCLHENTTKIRNIKKYLLTSLFNAPSTIDGYYLAEVNHDMGGEAAGS